MPVGNLYSRKINVKVNAALATGFGPGRAVRPEEKAVREQPSITISMRGLVPAFFPPRKIPKNRLIRMPKSRPDNYELRAT